MEPIGAAPAPRGVPNVLGTRISASGQTTVPVAVREGLSVGVGSFLYWALREDGVAVVSGSPTAAEQTLNAAATGQLAMMGALPSGRAYVNEWPSSFWEAMGAVGDPTFRVPDEAPRDGAGMSEGR